MPANNNDAWKAHAALVLVQLNYGAYHVVAKLALSVGMNQVVFCMLRDAVALAILGPVAFFKDRKIRPPISRQLLFSFFLLGLTGIFGNQLLFIIGLKLTSPSHAAALQPAVPVFTFILALSMGTVSVNWSRCDGRAKLAGLLVCVAGAFVMTVYKGPPLVAGFDTIDLQTAMEGKPSPEPIGWFATLLVELGVDLWHIGDLCILGNCLCMATYIALQAPLLARYPAPLSLTAYSYFFGALLMVFTGLFSAREQTSWVFTDSEILSVIYAGTVASALNYWLVAWTNRILGPSLVALYMPLQPLASSVLAHIFLGSPVYLGSVLGGCLIVAGLYCMTWGNWQSDRLDAITHKRESSPRLHLKKEDGILADTLHKLFDSKGVSLPVSRPWTEL